MKRYLGELIKQKYDVDDLPLSDFTGEVIRAYEVYLKSRLLEFRNNLMDTDARILDEAVQVCSSRTRAFGTLFRLIPKVSDIF